MPLTSLITAQLIETLSVGGAENLALQIAGELNLRGHSSHLIVLKGEGPLSARVHSGVKIHYMNFELDSISNPIAFAKSIKSGQALLTNIIKTNTRRKNNSQTHLN